MWTFAVFLLAIVVAATGQPQNRQFYRQQQFGSDVARPVVYPRILKQSQDSQYDGSFNYAFETEDGTSAQAAGVLKNPGSKDEALSVQGSYSYRSDDGQVLTVTYTADENGFKAEGAHLPTPPPVPEAIARALEYLRSLPPSDDNKF
ncbi:endocuticle structural glycoprotein SgAbd-3-like [Cimex lectularius]|uniref:CPR type cuticle protein n=1 Tax=Cimex lectularius TaxID=79782 RepID=A0A8I6RKP2_CIMLE|nr:endocuticle structural glycoprotein SgAbd-3-like [Cimex lectularius]